MSSVATQEVGHALIGEYCAFERNESVVRNDYIMRNHDITTNDDIVRGMIVL